MLAVIDAMNRQVMGIRKDRGTSAAPGRSLTAFTGTWDEKAKPWI